MTAAPTGPVGVGIVGAGRVVRSIHLPTLVRLRDLLHIRAVVDVDPDVAEAVAQRVNAASTTRYEELLEDPAIEVVAICSPAQLHADQIIRGMRAGKAAVFCEKPMAATSDEAAAIAAASVETGVPLVIGAMHTFDPAWSWSLGAARDFAGGVHTVRSSIVLPLDSRFEGWATESQGGGSSPGLPESDAALLRMAVLELAIHDLPLVRAFLPVASEARVLSAHVIRPFGYGITLGAGTRVAQLVGTIHGHWKPAWQFDALGDSGSLQIDFTPSFVHAGSGAARVTTPHGTRAFPPSPANGYEEEWRALAAIARGDHSRLPDLRALVDDFRFAVRIAEQAAEVVGRTACPA